MLCRKEPDVSSETLGIHIAMDGNQEGQVAHLLEKAREWADAFRTATGLPANDAWEGLLTTILGTFKYPAATTMMTREQWNEVLKPVLDVGLPKAGITRMFPRDVLFGPTLYDGLGVLHPFDFQELEHLETLLRCGNNDSTTGKLLRMSWEALKLEMGMPDSLTDLDYKLFESWATDCWLKTVWKYCWERDIQIEDPTPDLKLRRENDKFLMQAFVQSKKFSKGDLRKLNVCRCYLQAVSLADICSADGKDITPEAMDGIPMKGFSDKPEWPRQPSSLPADYWNVWKDALTKCFVRNTTRTRLWTPLGKWAEDPIPVSPWLFCPISNLLYQRQETDWKVYKSRMGRARNGTIFRGTQDRVSPALLPVGCRPALISHMNRQVDHVMLNNYSTHGIIEVTHPPAPTSLPELIASLGRRDGWAAGTMQFGHGEGNQIGGNVAAAILRGTARAVSDGSYKDHHDVAPRPLCSMETLMARPSEAAMSSQAVKKSNVLIAVNWEVCWEFSPS